MSNPRKNIFVSEPDLSFGESYLVLEILQWSACKLSSHFARFFGKKRRQVATIDVYRSWGAARVRFGRTAITRRLPVRWPMSADLSGTDRDRFRRTIELAGCLA